jgi:hypothetical protein
MSTTPAPGSQGWQQPTDEAAMRTAVALAIVKARRGNNGEKEAAERATAALQRLKKGMATLVRVLKKKSASSDSASAVLDQLLRALSATEGDDEDLPSSSNSASGVQQPRQQQQAPILQLPGCKRARTMLEVEEACCRLQGGSFRVHECPSEEGQMLSQQPEGHHHNHSTLPQQHIGCTPLLHLDPGGIQLASSNAAACSQFSMPASACEQIQQRIGTLLILDLVSSH